MTPRLCAPLDKIPEALEKTGFILEHAVAEEFKRAGWATIGGRYYADDVDGRARELDLVAYRIHKSDDVEVVTAVLVSCKKDAETTWAFLTKDRPKQDPNFDWDPAHYWTDLQPLQTYLSNVPWKDKYIKALGELYADSFKAERDVFAFQQISSQSVVPKNDKAIFDSIATLMKALDHEVQVLPNRVKTRKRLYMFFLLSVVDAPLVDVRYSGLEAKAVEIEKITYLCRYMVRKRELSALVHFVRSDRLGEYISSLTKLAEANGKHMKSIVSSSYEAIKSDESIQAYFGARLRSRLAWGLEQFLTGRTQKKTNVEDFDLTFVEGVLQIGINVFDAEVLAELNKHQSVKDATRMALRDIARYSGPFTFACEIPF